MSGGPVLPQVPGALPLLGHTVALLRAPLAFLERLPAYGEVVEVRLAGRRIVVVCDPELTRTMLVHDRVFDKGGPLYQRLREAGGHGVASCPASDHRRQRRLVQPAFHQPRLPGYAQVMTDRVEKALGSWRSGQRIDLTQEARKITAGVVIAAFFGTGLDEAAHARLAADFTVMMAGFSRRILMPEALCALPIPGNLRHRRATERIRQELGRLIADQRSADTAADAAPNLLSLLLAARDPDSDADAFTDHELVDQAITMYTAGTETTAGAVCWALHLAATHPDAQEKLRTEARTVLGGRAATWEDLPRLGYTRQVLTEAIRMYPPGWFLTRETTGATELGGHHLPAGTTVAYSPYLIGRLPALYEDPGRFDPGRWQAGERTPQAPATVFGGGARSCVGDRFAMVEGVLLLASMVGRWHLELTPDSLALPRLPQLTLNPGRMRATVTVPSGIDTPPQRQCPAS
ncbi:cytochrome P450 [Kitasatospora sp. NPDC088548]|uniref:cytochrome P450 n=1 Tax=Kitasatospora sp. NPDC088548 TaxID=3364075 RepID=UPI0037F61867